MKKLLPYFLMVIAIASCTKEETSVEGDGNVKYAIGTLYDSAKNCKNIIINGSYLQGIELTALNNIGVEINFSQNGNYNIYTDTVNGYWFSAKGFAFAAGNQVVPLKGYGKPINNVDANFTVHFNNELCYFKIKKFTPVLVNGTSNDYFPTTNFSTWVYDNNIIADTSVVSVTGYDKNIFGNTYRKFLLQVPKFLLTDTLYYRKDKAGNYYRYDTIATGPKMEYQFLKDYASVNDTFASPVVTGIWQGNPTNVRYFFTMLRKNVKRTIGANTIDSIIIMQAETQYLINGVYETKTTVEYSYAKKIGLVNIEQKNATNNLLSPVKSWVVN